MLDIEQGVKPYDKKFGQSLQLDTVDKIKQDIKNALTHESSPDEILKVHKEIGKGIYFNRIDLKLVDTGFIDTRCCLSKNLLFVGYEVFDQEIFPEWVLDYSKFFCNIQYMKECFNNNMINLHIIGRISDQGVEFIYPIDRKEFTRILRIRTDVVCKDIESRLLRN